jgi:ABC-type nitrate/sulfonate/bicarbonate transport system permease component
MKELFKIGAGISKKKRLLIELAGFIFFLFVWWLFTYPFVNRRIEFNAVGGNPPYTFELLNADKKSIIEAQNLSTFKIPEDGKYTLKLTDGAGKTNSIEFNAAKSADNQNFIQNGTSDLPGIQLDYYHQKPWVQKGILPAPGAVLISFKELAADKINLTVSQKYLLSNSSIEVLKNDSVPLTILNNLAPLLDKTFGNKDAFSAELSKILSPVDLAKYEFDVVKNAQISSILSVSSLLFNTLYSVLLNILGYLEAIAVSIIVGFIIALIPFFRGLLSRYIDAIRFVPLAAVTGLFIAWFGIDLNMKVQFLAFGIFVFLLPVVVQRIYEVEEVYKQTAFTLGATSWQTIRYVYWPHVLSRLLDDIRVLTAISWTYIIVAETVNKESGIGALIFTARRHSRLDHVFALLLLIIIIGFVQDLLFAKLDRKLNPHKY